MATTIANLIIPEVFDKHFLEQTAEKVRVLNPMVNQDDRFRKLVRDGGDILEMPFFQDLSGDSEVLSVGTAITVERLTDSQDSARRQGRAKGWTVNDLEAELTGADPLGQIVNRVSNYWARETQKLLLLTLDGVFADNANNDSSDLIEDISSEDYDNEGTQENFRLDRNALADAKNKIGDSGDTLNTIVVHSDVYTDLQKDDEIRDERDSEANLEFETFGGYRIIVDDSMGTEAGATTGTKYTSYLFGENAVGFAEGMADVPSELDRKAEESETRLFTRRQFMIHPRGFAWQENSVTDEFPSNNELADATNWDRVFEKKNVRIVKLVSNAG